MIGILLLDCSYSLAQKLKALGFNVESGTIGHCTGMRELPCQIYEKEIFIYNPAPYALAEGAIKDLTPQFDIQKMQSHIENGATFVAFLNRVSENIRDHKILYGWIPFMPNIEFTHDNVVHSNAFDGYPDWDWKMLTPVVNKNEVNLPVLLKINPPKPQEYGKDVFHLFANNHGECLAVMILRGSGRLIVLPKFNSNDAVTETFLHYVLPELYDTASKIGLIDEFTSPGERKNLDELDHFETLRKTIDSQLDLVRTQLETARRTKSTTISADATAKQILVYYEQARRQDASALFYLYKVIEAIENKYGGEANGIKAVGAGTEWKSVKRLANESYRDARHAPKPTDVIKQWSHEEIKKCFEETKKVVMAYFDRLFPQP